MARILIAGCGYLGTALGSRLAAAGHEVFGLRRRDTPLGAGITPIHADLGDIDSLRRLPSRLDFVFYTASSDGSDDRSYRSAYVDGLRYLLAALAGQEIRRLFLTSSTGVYAQTGGEWVDEDSPAEPVHFSRQRLLEGEQLLRSNRAPATVVRLAGIYGPGRARLLERVRKGEAAIPADGVYSNRIHRDDCAAVLQHLMTLDSPEALYLAADDDPAEIGVVIRWLAERVGAPPAAIDESHDARVRYGRTSNKRVRNTKLLASGYRFRYPTFREGYGELIREASREGSTIHG